MGLIARQAEAAGMCTVSLTSAWSITAAVNPPRAAFVDFPLGHTSGRPGEPERNRALVRAALRVAETAATPGHIVSLGEHWAGDDTWKDKVMRGGGGSGTGTRDERMARTAEPVYQNDEDRRRAELLHATGACGRCIGADPA